MYIRKKRWRLWTDWNEIAFSWRKLKNFSEKKLPKYTPDVWTLNFKLQPFRLLLFRRTKRVVWLGDWQWKRNLINLKRD